MQDRRERYAELANKAQKESDARYESARATGDMIPLGQPILVGHHSEKRHRNAIDKINKNMRKSIELSEKANYYEQKAEGYGTHGISSDDPEALTKLKEKLAKQQETHAILKVNRKKDKELVPAYMLTNSNGRMRATKKRIEQLEKTADRQTKIIATGFINGEQSWECQKNAEENRIMFIFTGKPEDEVRTILKGRSFKWSPTRGAWVRLWTKDAEYATRQVIDSIREVPQV